MGLVLLLIVILSSFLLWLRNGLLLSVQGEKGLGWLVWLTGRIWRWKRSNISHTSPCVQ